MWQEAILTTIFLGGLEKNYKKILVLPVFEPRFETETSPILCTIVNYYTTKLVVKAYLF